MNKAIKDYLEKVAKKQKESEEQEARSQVEIIDGNDNLKCHIECRGEVEAVARLVMAEVEQIGKEEYEPSERYRFLGFMDTIWEKQDQGDYDLAYDLLMMLLLTNRADSVFVINSMIYSCVGKAEYFMDYFCNELIDELLIGGEIDENDESESDCDM